MSKPILVERDGRIATVILNNPNKRNALTLAAWEALAAALAALDADEAMRCIVIRGAGDAAFAAGADISEFPRERATAAQAKAYGETVARCVGAVAGCRHPTVALIRGACTGGGLEIASACDLRICASTARLGIPINRLGHTLAYSELELLLRLVGPATALEMLLEGRIYEAPEALAKGLVNRVVADAEVETEAYATARRIAAGAPLVARLHKKFVRRLGVPLPLAESERDEAFAACDSEDYQIGFRAFLAKQTPEFIGR